jgi:large subunit ribosomal protein L10
MDRKGKEALVAGLRGSLERAQGTFLVDYQGLDVEAINRLRSELKKIGAEFQVVKNRLLKRAAEDTQTSVLEEYMHGPSAIAVTYEDVVSPARVLVDFAKDFKHLEIKNAQISGRSVDAEGIKRLAELPGRDALLAQTLSALQAVPTSLVWALNGVIVKLLNVLKAVEQQKAE